MESILLGQALAMDYSMVVIARSEPTYTPGTQDIINGQVTLTLTVDAAGACADNFTSF